jgi:ankyrin repeat protein
MTPLGRCVNASSGKRLCRRRRQAALELLRLGANPLLPCDSGGRSAVEQAAVYGDSEMVELLQKHTLATELCAHGQTCGTCMPTAF